MNLFDVSFFAENFVALSGGIPLTLQLTLLSITSINAHPLTRFSST